MLAAVPTEVSDAVSTGFSDLTTFLTGTVAAVVITIAIVGVAIALGVKWLRRGGR